MSLPKRIPSPALVESFKQVIEEYSMRAIGAPPSVGDVMSCDLQDLHMIFTYFVDGDQVSANGCVYRLFKDVRKHIPDAVLKFIFKHS